MSIPHFDKIVHFVIFFVFGMLLLVGFIKTKKPSVPVNRYMVLCLITGIVYGGLTEYLQHCCFTLRHGNIADFYANSAGTFFGVFAVVLVRKLKA
ncbi:MAG: VanZ family protein [Bacteroidales bacterium]|nr:VanZ family protein [Bacteroidales bacterium]